jgi:phytoene synthase
VLAGKTGEGLSALLGELRQTARTALRQACGLVAELDPRAQVAFLPLALVEPFLASLAKARDPLHEVADINPLYRLWRLVTWRA